MTTLLISRKWQHRKVRILIVNCYFDEVRRPIRRTHKIPQAMAPAYLAGAFYWKLCDIRLYSELYSGPLENEFILEWPDMLVLTGLTTAFDRMLHLTAYARSKNPKVIVVAGGPAIRALPNLARRFFDYCCTGDIEQIIEVIHDTFGVAHIAEEMVPRFDLAYWVGRVGYAETSRNCNFCCSFCTLSSEGGKYKKYDLDNIQKQIQAIGKKHVLVFLDNNFYGNDRKYFLKRLELLKMLWKEGFFKSWAALVTNDFFWRDDNLILAREAGCRALFSGLETFDTAWLQKFNKVQNTHLRQVDMIRKCLDAGIVFFYGMMLDPTSRSLADIKDELDFVISSPEITLPSYLSVPVPLPRTPFFYECLTRGAILPLTKLRDLDSTTLSLRTLNPINEVVDFLNDLQSLKGVRSRLLWKMMAFLKRYSSKLSHKQLMIALANSTIICVPKIVTAPSWIEWRKTSRRTYVSSTEPLDISYSPAFNVNTRYKHYFNPTMVTDKKGRLTEQLSELLEKTIPTPGTMISY